MKKSLMLNREFVNSISDTDLDKLMSEFDDYQVDLSNHFHINESFNNYIKDRYKKNDLFSLYDEEYEVNIK